MAKKYDSLKSTSKFISLILRHHPETVGITLDEHGWADVQELIEGINKNGRHKLTRELLRVWMRQRIMFTIPFLAVG